MKEEEEEVQKQEQRGGVEKIREKKKKKKKSSSEEVENNKTSCSRRRCSKALNPFMFFIKTPPRIFARCYYQIADFFEGLQNKDQNIKQLSVPLFSEAIIQQSLHFHHSHNNSHHHHSNKHKHKKSQLEISVSEMESFIMKYSTTATQQRSLSSEEEIEKNWRKLCVIDRILSLSDPEEWNGSNKRFGTLRKRVWWVHKAEKWVSKIDNTSTHDGYIKVALCALVLELFYRFCWARHTLLEYQKQIKQQQQQQISTNSSDVDRLPQEQPKNEEIEEDDVLSLKELGEGEEEEDEEEEEDNNNNNDEEMEMDEDKIIGTTSTTTRQATIAKREDENDENYIEPEEVEINSDDENEEQNESEEESESNNGTFSLPTRVPLFFPQETIIQAVDEIEGEFLEKTDPLGTFDVTKSFWALSRLVELRDKQKQDETTAKTSQSLISIFEELFEIYKKHFVGFIWNIGIDNIEQENKEKEKEQEQAKKIIWKWSFENEETMRFVDSMFISTFINLTNNGEGANTTSLALLFPHLSSLQDSRVDMRLPEICSSITQQLQTAGKLNTEVDKIVSMINSLSDERKTLIKSNELHQIQSNYSTTAPSTTTTTAAAISTPNSVLDIVSESRKRRLLEIDSLIEKLRDEFHRLTESADKEQPKKKPKTLVTELTETMKQTKI